MSNLKLEAGKFYRTRSGGKAKLSEQMGDLWIGAFFSFGDRWLANQWHESGKYYPPTGQHGLDIISEWNDDDDWEDIDPTKITLAMFPLEARFHDKLTESWKYSKLYGYWVNAKRYQCDTTWWEFCQVKKGVQK